MAEDFFKEFYNGVLEMQKAMGNVVNVTEKNGHQMTSIIGEIAATKELVGDLSGQVKTMGEDLDDVIIKVNNLERNKKINKSQKRAIRDAVKRRVGKLLDITWDKYGHVDVNSIPVYTSYYRPFVMKCYIDCSYLGHLASPYDETRSIDYDNAMDDIENWRPRGGVKSYKDYLDNLHSLKS